MPALIVDLEKAAQLLIRGSVGILPSDTVYGLMACADNQQAVERFYSLKQREHKPGTIIAANVGQLVRLGLPAAELEKIAHLWPNPLSLIIPSPSNLSYLSQGVGSLACRIPADEKLRAFLEKTGPLVTSSANLPGEPTAETIAEAVSYFEDRVDFYVDAGPIVGRLPSTVIKLAGDKIEVIRQGAYVIS